MFNKLSSFLAPRSAGSSLPGVPKTMTAAACCAETRALKPGTDVFGARTDEASVLILALWTLFFLTALALAVGGRVSAVMAQAGALKRGVTSTYLTRAGAERAAMDILQNSTNWNFGEFKDWVNNPELYQSNAVLAGGTFSVTYAFAEPQSGMIGTNYGVLAESQKIYLNAPKPSSQWDENRDKLAKLVGSSQLAEAILGWPEEKKKLAMLADVGYSAAFESPQEMLLVEGVTYDVFLALEPHVTVLKRQRAERAFGGLSEGSVVPQGVVSGLPVDRRRVAFVFDSRTAKFVYWHEH